MVKRGKFTEDFLASANASRRGYAAFAKSYKLVEKLGMM